MAECYVDIASVYDVIGILEHADIEYTNAVEMRTAAFVTWALISSPHVKLGSSPSKPNDPSGGFGVLLSQLRERLTTHDPLSEQKDAAYADLQTWLIAGGATVTRKLTNVVTDAATGSDRSNPYWQLAVWQRRTVDVGWRDHIDRLNCLFDIGAIPLISGTLDVPASDLHRIASSCWSPDYVRALLKREESEEFHLARRANFCWGLMRGRYHKSLASRAGLQITLHEFRDGVVIDDDEAADDEFRASQLAILFSALLLARASQESTLHERIAFWAKWTKTTSQAQFDGDVNLDRHPDEETAKNDVLKIANQIQLPVKLDLIDKVHDLFLNNLNAPINGVLKFVPHPLVTKLIGGAAEAVIRRSKSTIEKATRRHGELERLRDLGAGLLGRRPILHLTTTELSRCSVWPDERASRQE